MYLCKRQRDTENKRTWPPLLARPQMPVTARAGPGLGQGWASGAHSGLSRGWQARRAVTCPPSLHQQEVQVGSQSQGSHQACTVTGGCPRRSLPADPSEPVLAPRATHVTSTRSHTGSGHSAPCFLGLSPACWPCASAAFSCFPPCSRLSLEFAAFKRP